MRITLSALCAISLAVAVASPAAADEPLICLVTGATHVGPYTVDPPDPCLL